MDKIVTILMVDDNIMDIELTLITFKRSRLTNTIQIVHNGKEALQYIMGDGKYANRDMYPVPNVVLLDINMPEVDGYEVLEHLQKSSPEIQKIPILILTFSTEEGERIINLYPGADGYLVKPITFNDFLEEYRKVNNYTITLFTK